MQTLILGILDESIVPFAQELTLFVRGEERERRHTLRRIGDNAFEQRSEVRLQTRNRIRTEKVCTVHESRRQAVLLILHLEVEVEFSRSGLDVPLSGTPAASGGCHLRH